MKPRAAEELSRPLMEDIQKSRCVKIYVNTKQEKNIKDSHQKVNEVDALVM